jgi:hypothetical protein
LGYCYDDEPDCPCEAGPIIDPGPEPPTIIRGEDVTIPRFEDLPTLLRGEDGGPFTTLAIGEEGPSTWVEDGGLTWVENVGLPDAGLPRPVFGRFNPARRP